MCGIISNFIQSTTAENRRRKKKEEEETTGVKYNVRICYAGRPKISTDLNDCIASGIRTLETLARAPSEPTRWIPAARRSEASHWLTPGRSDQSAATSRPSLYRKVKLRETHKNLLMTNITKNPKHINYKQKIKLKKKRTQNV